MRWLDRLAERMLMSPILWGGLMSAVMHVVLRKIPTRLPPWLLERLTGQWESYVGSTLFLIGVAFVVIRAVKLIFQARAWQQIQSDEIPENDQEAALTLAKWLEILGNDWWSKRSLLYSRLQAVQRFMLRPSSNASTTTFLKDLSDADQDLLHANYGLMRMLIWAIPSCGSVATILAIGQVVEKLPTDGSTDILAGTAAGLSGAFHLFAFTVGMAIGLVALKYAIEQAEQLLLAAIDRQVNLVVAPNVDEATPEPATQAAQLQQIAEALKTVTNLLVQQSQNASKAPVPAPVVPAAPAGPAVKDIENIVQAAIAGAMQRQPAAVVASGGELSGIDAAGWKGLQHVLQKLAHVLEQQNAKLESEGRVTKQLTTIIDEGLKDMHPPLRIHDGRQSGMAPFTSPAPSRMAS